MLMPSMGAHETGDEGEVGFGDGDGGGGVGQTAMVIRCQN